MSLHEPDLIKIVILAALNENIVLVEKYMTQPIEYIITYVAYVTSPDAYAKVMGVLSRYINYDKRFLFVDIATESERSAIFLNMSIIRFIADQALS